MKNILCYGDSNTWGYNPVSGERHLYKRRWTSLVQDELGDEFLVIPEGLNGRTTVWDDPLEPGRSGSLYLPSCLKSHAPLDMVIIMLGTNDLKSRFGLCAQDIALGVGGLVDLVKKNDYGINGGVPEILVLVPPEVKQLSGFSNIFAGSREKSLQFPAFYAEVCKEHGVSCLDIGCHVHFSDVDGIHFEEDQLPVLGRLLAAEIRQVLL